MAPKTIRLRNPNFPEQSLHTMSWTLVVKGKFPEGRKTVCCGVPTRPQEVVITFPDKSPVGDLRGTVVVHKQCLVEFLECVPDERSVVQKKVDRIVKVFVKD